MKASIGRIVRYPLTLADAERINKRREDASHSGLAQVNTGAQLHVGNKAEEGQFYPLLITRVWSEDLVNGQVFLDGNDTLWVTSSHQAPAGEAERPGFWSEPPRV